MGRVFVAGSINMDVVATADRHPRIGETVAGHAVHYFPGGKGANQAVAAAKLGAPTTLIGRVAKDAFGDQLQTFLAAQGVDLSFVQDTAEAHTGTAIITVADADNTIVVVPGANASVTPADVEAPLLAKATSRSASSRFRCPPLPLFSNGPAPWAQPRSSIRRRQRNSAASCSISSIF
jgi:ribokinase